MNIHLRVQYRMRDIDQAQEDLADNGQKGSMLDALRNFVMRIFELLPLLANARTF